MWKKMVIETFQKLTNIILNSVDEDIVKESFNRKNLTLIKINNVRFNLNSLASKIGFSLSEERLFSTGLERVFNIWFEPLVSISYLKAALDEDYKLNEILKNLSDDSSRDIFKGFVNFQIINSFIGSNWKRSDGTVDLIKKTFPDLEKFIYDANEIENIFQVERYKYKDIIEVKKNDIVFDVGAYVGLTTIYFLQKGAKKVFSFEPLFVDELEKNLRNHGMLERVVVVRKAVSNKNQKVFINAGGAATFISNRRKLNTVGEIFTITLDDFVYNNKISRIDFIKIDVEGHEIQVLEGATRILKNFRPLLAIAAYHRPLDPYNFIQFLKKLGYRNFFLKFSGDLVLFASP